MSVATVVNIGTTATGLAAALGAPILGQLGPGVGTDLSGPLRGAVSFVLVLVSGALILRFRRNYLDKSISAISDSPATAVLYGIAGYVIVSIVALYAATTLARLSVVGGVFVRIVIVGAGAFVVGLTSFGFLVVGTLITEILRNRQPTRGLFIGASLSAVIWALLSPAGGTVSTLAIAAFGIGGSVRSWIHAERTVETEVDAR